MRQRQQSVGRRPPKGWQPSGGLIPRSSRWPPSPSSIPKGWQPAGGLIPGRGVACYARATAKSAIGEPRAAHGPTGTATRFWPSASGAPASYHQIRVAVPPCAKGVTNQARRPGGCTCRSPRIARRALNIALTTSKESSDWYKIFINVTHSARMTHQKVNLTNLLSTTYGSQPLPKKQKMCDKFDKSGTLIATLLRPPPRNRPTPNPLPKTLPANLFQRTFPAMSQGSAKPHNP
jgi:hypothetical protein